MVAKWLSAGSARNGPGLAIWVLAIRNKRFDPSITVADEVKGKLLPHADGQGLIAKGEADLGLYYVSEIRRAKA
jgi:hypothetical protein